MTQSFDENVNNNDDSPRTGVTGNTENILENSTIGTSTTADKNQGQDEHQNQKLDINSPEFEVLRAELAKLYQKNSTQEQHKVFEIIDIVKYVVFLYNRGELERAYEKNEELLILHFIIKWSTDY